MKNAATIFLAILGWFSVVTQFYLMMENRITPVGETIIRFISFFTILTNSLVALYFSCLALKVKTGLLSIFTRPGAGTAITVYITIVGLVYQILLRHIWQPTGLQMIVDELLHTVIPFLAIVYWLLFEDKSGLKYKAFSQ